MNNIKMPLPKVIIDRMALEKIRYFVNKDSQECSGMGITRVVGDTIYVDDVKMLEQTNGAAHTDINEEAVTKLMYEWREREGELNFWWHSHVNMGVFWSTTDLSTINQLGQHGMCVASVFNKKGEIRTAVAAKIEVPFAEGNQVVLFDELTLHVQTAVPEAIKQLWDQEHKDNVKVWTPTVWTGHDNDSHRRQNIADWRDEGKSSVFKFVKTQIPGFWDDFNQARNNDIDWRQGCFYDREMELYEFSKKHLAAQNAWLMGEGAKLVTETSQEEQKEATRQEKIRFAQGNEDIVGYEPLLEMFELVNKTKVDAAWYMDACAKAQTADEIITAEIEKFEKDMQDKAGADTPFSPEDLDDMYSKFYGEHA